MSAVTKDDLGRAMALRDECWSRLSEAERAAWLPRLRAEYVAAGWKICAHGSCPPWDCQNDSAMQ